MLARLSVQHVCSLLFQFVNLRQQFQATATILDVRRSKQPSAAHTYVIWLHVISSHHIILTIWRTIFCCCKMFYRTLNYNAASALRHAGIACSVVIAWIWNVRLFKNGTLRTRLLCKEEKYLLYSSPNPDRVYLNNSTAKMAVDAVISLLARPTNMSFTHQAFPLKTSGWSCVSTAYETETQQVQLCKP